MYHKLASLHIYTVLLTSVLTRELVALCRPLKTAGNLQLCRFYRVYTAIQDLKSPDISHPLILERCMSCHLRLKVTLRWTPDHVGISGTEEAHGAKDATLQNT
jgi:hypothetical protein